MAIKLEEINTLVWRYLNENGFQHTAFLFKTESMVEASDSSVSHLPSGILISLLQKSLLYLQLEKRVNKARSDPNDILHDKILLIESYFPEPSPKPPDENSKEIPSDQPVTLRISSSIASILTIHKQCVFACAFSPNGSLLGTGSEDGTAIIWEMKDGVPIDSKTVGYLVDEENSNQNDQNLATSDVGITSVDFDSTGQYFATGSFDSFIRLYDNQGKFITKMGVSNHNIFTIKFSPSGKYLLSCSDDKTALVWNIPSGNIHCPYMHHTDAILGASWRDDNIFATASADNCIGICHINGQSRLYSGHQNQVTCVAWSYDGKMLASASEDATIRIWKINNAEELFNMPSMPTQPDIKIQPNIPNIQNPHSIQNPQGFQGNQAYPNIQNYPNMPNMPNIQTQIQNMDPSMNIHGYQNYQNIQQPQLQCVSIPSIVLPGHEKGVSCVSWIPQTEGLLVSASQDGTIRLWDAVKAMCLNRISHHTLDIISLACSPDGKYIASGGSDQTIVILDVSKHGELLATFIGSSTVFDIQWDPKGRYIAACFDDSTVAVIPTEDYLK